jgi:2,4-dienoyl-CoA reductase (NADPH2)
VRLNSRADADALIKAGFDDVVIATGIEPRAAAFEGADHSKVASYIDVIMGNVVPGKRVAIVGAGGIGFDVAELVTHAGVSGAIDKATFAREWGIDFDNHPRGGVTGVEPAIVKADREVWLLQRSEGSPGRGLGKTTGWTHKLTLQRRDVHMIGGVEYRRMDDDGLHITVSGEPRLIPVDTVIVCAGQEPSRALFDALNTANASHGITVHAVGGAKDAQGLDAKRAIREAVELAAQL